VLLGNLWGNICREREVEMWNERFIFFVIGLVIGLFIGGSGVIKTDFVENRPNIILMADVE
jgi:hypothetical protein